MRGHYAKGLMLAGTAAATALVLTACSGDASPTAGSEDDDPAAFYEGKTLTMVVPYNPGGGFDAYLRLLVPYLEEQLPDTTIRVENQPGGGGLIGANAVYQAEPDGLTIGLINYPGAVFAEVTGTDGVTFESTEWTQYGRLGALPPLVYTSPDTEYTSFDDILGASDTVKFGLGGVGSDAYYVAVAISNVFDFPHEIIGGYPGSNEADAALLAGEVDVSVNSGGAGVLMVEGSGAHGVVAVSNEPLEQLPDVPVIGEFGDADQQEQLAPLASVYDLERMVVGPPGVPEARADYLAEAIFAAASESGYADEMEAASYPVNALNRADTMELSSTVSESIESLSALLSD
ncbi:Bug family tripartite tricarboxylate transporter substrate binding protein [Jiangella endophytica]|uniref:Bug family tripartite tricarboxylate transporter substrate binding protein n=1 Tax=Jiangella endophytica TaxID=1623398 RepID=UPI000E354E51|nr:tripartite tricarboxylate transporter substrate-binding protein [Jiangella endophytica]